MDGCREGALFIVRRSSEQQRAENEKGYGYHGHQPNYVHPN